MGRLFVPRGIGCAAIHLDQDEPAGIEKSLASIGGVKSVSRAGECLFKLECWPKNDPREKVFRAAVENGWILLEMREERASLEDIFVRLTTQEDAGSRDLDEDSESTVSEGAS